MTSLATQPISNNHRPVIALWGTPRSISTALEKVFTQSEELVTTHEPYTDAYYFSEIRKSSRYSFNHTRILSEEDVDNIEVSLLSKNQSKRQFFKDLAFQAEPYITNDGLLKMEHVVITRHPMAVYSSLIKLKPDFTEEEFGFLALERLCRRLDDLEKAYMVVDGDRFRANPESCVSSLFGKLGLNYAQNLLTWEDGHIRNWKESEAESQGKWHKSLESSNSIIAPKPLVSIDIPKNRECMYQSAIDIYEALLDKGGLRE